jgi:hypothetical protein
MWMIVALLGKDIVEIVKRTIEIVVVEIVVKRMVTDMMKIVVIALERKILGWHCRYSIRTVPMPSIRHCNFVAEIVERMKIVVVAEIEERIGMMKIVEIVEIVEIVVVERMIGMVMIVVIALERKILGWHCHCYSQRTAPMPSIRHCN